VDQPAEPVAASSRRSGGDVDWGSGVSSAAGTDALTDGGPFTTGLDGDFLLLDFDEAQSTGHIE
jgi:hypothetical protein